MKVIVDQDTCIGCGLCADDFPDVFEMGDDGKAHAVAQTVPSEKEDAARGGAEECPVDAIEVE